mgnify:CR=1 FL=1
MPGILKLLIIGLGVYAALSIYVYYIQSSLIYYPNMPGRSLAATPEAIGLSYQDIEFVTEDDVKLHGWFIPNDNAEGTVLFFHGNAGNISHRLQSIDIFNRMNLNVFILDYRGYGQSEGKTTEKGTYLDAQAAWDHLVNTQGIRQQEIIIFGRSLGGAVGAWLASQPDVRPAGVIIESCFSSGKDMGKRLYPVLPVRLITRIRYPVKEYVTRIQAPVLVAHSRHDEIIPFDMGQMIFDQAQEPKSFLEMQGDHNAGFWLSRETYVPALDVFLTRVLWRDPEAIDV